MKCKKFKKMLPGYLCGEIPEKDKQVFMGHVSDCADCRKLLSGMEEAVLVLQSLPKPAFSESEKAGLRFRVKEMIAKTGTEPVPSRRTFFQWLILQPRFVPVSALVAVVAIISVVLLHRPADRSSVPVNGEVNELIVMTEDMEEEYKLVTEICREIDRLQALFSEEAGSGPEVGVKSEPLIAPA